MVKKAGKHMEKAKSYGIQVVPESFVDACKEGGNAADHLISMNLASWGSNVSFLYIYFFFSRNSLLFISHAFAIIYIIFFGFCISKHTSR